jgi:hypothetical protein
MRNRFLALLVLALGTTAAPAQGWAEKMFKGGLTHDFGSVPRGAQLVHRFTITNIYAVPMKITAIRSGCGCVKATAAATALEPRASTTLEVRMDARRFTGAKTVRVRVTVGPEFVSTAELQVSATSRADVVFNPGQVNLGAVTRGQTPSQTIDVEYAGALRWEVSEVVARDAPYTVALKEWYRRPGQVGYRLTVALKPNAPVGALSHDLFLKTNDPASPLVPLLVEANVQTALTVSPASLSLGTVKAGTPLVRRVVVRGTRPFHVVGVDGTGAGTGIDLGAPLSTTDALVQTVTFKCAFDAPGDFKRELKIRTNLPEAAPVVTLDGTVTK